jgi:hypothetical protein
VADVLLLVKALCSKGGYRGARVARY